MRRSLRAAVLALLLTTPSILLAEGSDAAHPTYSTARLRLRQAPSTSSEVIATIPRGALLEIRACSAGWCQASYRSLPGYVAESYLSTTVPPQILRRTERGYLNSRGEHVQSPTWTESGRPPAGASAQCGDGSYSFSRSRRGTCSHHGGVVRWL